MATKTGNIGIEEAANSIGTMTNKGTVPKPSTTAVPPAVTIPGTAVPDLSFTQNGTPYINSDVTVKLDQINDGKFDPQKSSNFLITSGDDELNMVIESIERPVPGDEAYIKAVFRDFVDVDVLGKLLEWKTKGPRRFAIQLLTGDGVVVEEIMTPRGEISKITATPLSYNDTGALAKFEVTIHGNFSRRRVVRG